MHALLAIVALSFSGVLQTLPRSQSTEFVFGGLGLRTTIEEAKHRYPRSSIVGQYVYVAEADSHDHIYGIALPGADRPKGLSIFFEKSRNQAARYSHCEQIVGMVEKQYGPPSRTEDFTEEQSRNRRLSWERSGEVLSVLCFRQGQASLFAERLTIAATR